MLFLFVVAPEHPVEGYLGTKDGEEEGEEAVAEVVDPGGIDHEGGGDRQRGDDKEERDPEHEQAEGAPEGAIRLDPRLRLFCARAQLHQSCLPVVFSVEEPFFSETPSFFPDSPFPCELPW